MIFTKDFKIIKSSRISKEEKVRNIFYPHKIIILSSRAVKKFLSSRVIMNSRRLWNSHKSHKLFEGRGI